MVSHCIRRPIPGFEKTGTTVSWRKHRLRTRQNGEPQLHYAVTKTSSLMFRGHGENFQSSSRGPYWQKEPNMESFGQTEMWFTESQTQNHNADYRKALSSHYTNRSLESSVSPSISLYRVKTSEKHGNHSTSWKC
ncbi:uncharacterized protein LOC144616924 [Panthera onca]